MAMRNFELEQLRTLVAAVEAGSLTAAVSVRCLSQSALSEQLRKLEEQAGQTLLVRSKSGVVATDAGSRLIGHARRLIALSDSAWQDFHGDPLAGDVRLAITDYFHPSDISALLARFAAQHAKVRLHVTIDRSDAIDEGYARGEFDVAVVMRVASAKSTAHTVILGRDDLAWVGVADTISLEEQALPLVALPESCSLRRLAETLLRKRRVPYYIAHVASGVPGLRLAVAAGLGVACLNVSALDGPLVALRSRRGLPALPEVSFRVLPARAGEAAVITSMRALAIEAFSTKRALRANTPVKTAGPASRRPLA